MKNQEFQVKWPERRKNIRYAAMDQNGEWHFYENEPRIIGTVWAYGGTMWYKTRNVKGYTGSWKDSLQTRYN